MNENIKLPYVLSNINSIDKILLKKTKIGIVFKEYYRIFRNTNIAYFARLIDLNTDLVDYYIFSSISNAILSRQLGIKKRILLIYPITPEESLLASDNNIEIDCPNIDWLHKTINILNGKELNVHIWYDSGLSREGIIDENILYNLLKEIKKYPNIKINGLATKYNPNTNGNYIKSSQLIFIPIEKRSIYYANLIKDQIEKFNKIISYCRNNNLIDNNTIIHNACSNEVVSKCEHAYNDMVRVGTLVWDGILNNFQSKSQIISIKTIPKDFCIGYYCKNGKAPSEIKVAYIKSMQISYPEYYYKGKLLNPIESGDPCGLIVNDIDDIKVGDFIDIKSERFYS
jgi:alanine racemase